MGNQSIAVPAHWETLQWDAKQLERIRDTRMGHQSKAVPVHRKVLGTLEWDTSQLLFMHN